MWSSNGLSNISKRRVPADLLPERRNLTPIVASLAKDYHPVHIKTQEVFNATAKVAPPQQWIWDDVHPLPEGHELIASNWIEPRDKNSSSSVFILHMRQNPIQPI